VLHNEKFNTCHVVSEWYEIKNYAVNLDNYTNNS